MTQVAGLLEKAIQGVRHGEGVPGSAESVADVYDARHSLGDCCVNFREALSPCRLETVAQAHAIAAQPARGKPVERGVAHAHDRALHHPHKGAVIHWVGSQPEKTEHVFDLLTVEKAGSAGRDIGNPVPAKLILELARKMCN